jgi:hypothetical protein
MITTSAPSPFGDPFSDASERLLWEAGFPSEFETQAEADAAIAELRQLPQFAGMTFSTAIT